MRRTERRLVHRAAATVAGLLATLTTAAGAAAQVPWETPYMVTPRAAAGLGIAFVDFASTADAGLGMLLTWRTAPGPGVTVRGGAAEGFDGEITGYGGIDVSASIAQASADLPLDVVWTSGVGAALGRYLAAAAPVGFAIGRTWAGESVEFAPFASFRTVLEGRWGTEAPDETFALDLAAEIGTELALGAGRAVLLRAAASFGDRSALLLGVQLGGRRP